MRHFLNLFSVMLLAAGCAGTAPAATGGDAERGAQIFSHGLNTAPPCSSCHLVVEGEQRFSLGPNLAGVSERAPARVEGLTPEAYIRQSILEPHRYVVGGYRDIMYPNYSEHFADQDVADLVAYLLTI
jgi:mono/diheme cytochrome c family protein